MEYRNAAWDYNGYWNVVLGDKRSAARVAAEFDLDVTDRRGLDEWLGQAESEAWAARGSWAGHDEEYGDDLPEEWGAFHERALDDLSRAQSEPAS